jgi:hypothetical protein
VNVEVETEVQWHGVMAVDDLWVGEMVGIEVEGEQIVILRPPAWNARTTTSFARGPSLEDNYPAAQLPRPGGVPRPND